MNWKEIKLTHEWNTTSVYRIWKPHVCPAVFTLNSIQFFSNVAYLHLNEQCPPNHSRDENCQPIRICERVTVCPSLFVSTWYTVTPRSRLIRMMTPVCTLTTYFIIHFNIALSSLRRPFRFFNKFSIKHKPNSKKMLYSYNVSLESRVL
jgi:hypothetical protein